MYLPFCKNISRKSLNQHFLNNLNSRFIMLSWLWTKDSTRVRTAHAVLESYSALSVEALLLPLDSGFTHQILPSSLDMPLRTKELFATHASRVTSIFSTFSMVPQSIFEDPARNSVIVHAKMIGELIGIGPWENECIIIMKMSEDGTKVVEHTEFVDSLRAKLLQEKLKLRGSENLMIMDNNNGDNNMVTSPGELVH